MIAFHSSGLLSMPKDILGIRSDLARERYVVIAFEIPLEPEDDEGPNGNPVMMQAIAWFVRNAGCSRG